MDIFGFNIVEIIKNPVAGILGGVASVALFAGYKFIMARINPERAIDFFFDKICYAMTYSDNQWVDKIRVKKIKKDLQARIRESVIRGINRVENTLDEIAD